ncbi:PDZ domain-containing protein [Terribacillus halophilus]|uniref:endopeptidase La n=1 Tax=Terribacillus halophilus TaxID=361279 RepID=A0A1G6NIG8_9BACI|nr:SepM family pheromone-processing serine protease [Terribacillus halophilus]SDC67431.1 PDZ domain-containing protein [Terribacillus halophilus]
MKQNKRYILFVILLLLIVFCFSGVYRMPYYVYKPGAADALDPIVSVDGSEKSEGDMHLVTVRGGQATPFQYVMAKILPYHQIEKLEDVIPEGISEEEYTQAQLMQMESSQEASTVVAYEAAGADLQIDYKGVYVVSVVKDLPADGQLKQGDLITAVDEQEVKEATDLTDYVTSKKIGDTITLQIERDDEQLEKKLKLQALPDTQIPGIGITLVTDRDVSEDPKVTFSSGQIGGPSAGLMFSLEIYDQLEAEDLTKGYQICGTGEVDYEGNVGRIGGIDKKVVAADKEGCDIFFAPNEQGAADSNYEVAKQTAEDIGTDMKIIPVDTFEDAKNYLEQMPAK